MTATSPKTAKALNLAHKIGDLELVDACFVNSVLDRNGSLSQHMSIEHIDVKGLCYSQIMPLNDVVQRVSDSRIGMGKPSRPGSFTALMGLYESNYVRLGWLLGNLRNLHGSQRSVVSGDLPLHVAVKKLERYTTTLHLTYWFDIDSVLVADPDLDIRIYHDARLAEVMACQNRRQHAVLKEFDTASGTELEVRWMRNMMLNKWLEYCADMGHRFAQPDETSAQVEG